MRAAAGVVCGAVLLAVAACTGSDGGTAAPSGSGSASTSASASPTPSRSPEEQAVVDGCAGMRDALTAAQDEAAPALQRLDTAQRRSTEGADRLASVPPAADASLREDAAVLRLDLAPDRLAGTDPAGVLETFADQVRPDYDRICVGTYGAAPLG